MPKRAFSCNVKVKTLYSSGNTWESMWNGLMLFFLLLVRMFTVEENLWMTLKCVLPSMKRLKICLWLYLRFRMFHFSMHLLCFYYAFHFVLFNTRVIITFFKRFRNVYVHNSWCFCVSLKCIWNMFRQGFIYLSVKICT